MFSRRLASRSSLKKLSQQRVLLRNASTIVAFNDDLRCSKEFKGMPLTSFRGANFPEFTRIPNLKLDTPKNSGNDSQGTVDKSKPKDDSEPAKEDDISEDKDQETDISDKKSTESESKSETKGAAAAASGGSNSNGGNGGNGNNRKKSFRKPTVEHPKKYPQLLALSISHRPLFPGFYKAVIISDPAVISAVREMIDKKQPYIATFLQKDETVDTDIITTMDEVYPIGVLGQITSIFTNSSEQPNGETMTLLIYPHKRIRMETLTPAKSDEEIESYKAERVQRLEAEVVKELEESGKKFVELEKLEDGVEPDEARLKIEKANSQFLKEKEVLILEKMHKEEKENPTLFLKNHSVSLSDVETIEDEPIKDNQIINALTSEILKVFREISELSNTFREQIATFSASVQSSTSNVFEEPARLADFAAAVSAAEDKELQEILGALDIEQRLSKALVVIKKELMNAELQNKISKDVEMNIQKRQREYYLIEKLKGIKKELGIDDGREKLVETFKKRVAKLKMPENVEKVFNDELTKLSTLEPAMSEFGVVRNYLDWITQLPWGIKSKERYDIPAALKILDEDHYGLKDVKDRILEFIAVGKLLGKVDGKILCFVGPPGVGKTSIAKSIARALNRKYYRFSVGGMTDVTEIKGHRRTYIGALPGRIVQGLKKSQSENPLILIDEIDKIGYAGVHGDPSAALLELLDPEQNNSFLDNYLDLPIDLSKVLFVCTANTLDTIPRPLLDRMEVIEISGYIADEKAKIAENYLIPQAKEKSGLKDAAVELTDDAIENLIKQYCRESGVRNLKRQIEKVYRKAALKVVQQLEPVSSTDSDEIEVKEIKAKSDSLAEEKISEVSDESSSSADTGPSEAANNSDATSASSSSSAFDEKTLKSDSASESINDTKTDGEGEVVDGVATSETLKIPKDLKITIGADNLKDYIGPAIFTTDRLYETTIPGVVMGLAWTSMGGSALYIESVLNQPIDEHSRPGLERTGQLGDVMKESTTIAYSFAKMYLAKKYPKNRFFQSASIHLHCPEGATPKDGPSAGVTIASSFLSLALNKSLAPTVAMTGEITLTGKVLKIGGLKEKTIAAKRSGAKTIIFPKDNLSDWIELPENIKEGLEYLPAEWYDEIFDKLFPDVTEKQGNNVWKKEFEEIDKKEKKKD